MNNERLIYLTEKYGAEFAKEILKDEGGQPANKPENKQVADMISEGTKKELSDRKEREEKEIRSNLLTWGGRIG